MIFEQVKSGGDRNFSYLIADEKTKLGAIVDPGYEPERVIEIARKHFLKIIYLFNTHSHYDHTAGNDYVLKATSARLVGYGLKEPAIKVRDQDILKLGEIELKIIHTPGHTEDSICILAGDKLITGDTLFVGKVGGTGYGDDARKEYDSLHKKLMSLPDNIEVYPGHDYGVSPKSTIGNERRTNPFLLQKNFDDFLHLKKTWLEYKRIHGIK